MSLDVIVVGGGGAALCAAQSAREHGARVLVLERAPIERRGGNTAFASGTFRMIHDGADDIQKVVPDLSEQDIARTDFGRYTAEQYFDDLGRITQYYTDPDLADVLVHNSADTVRWLHGRGIRFLPNYGRQAYLIDGRFKFFGGSVIFANGGGRGLMEQHYRSAESQGVDIRYQARAIDLVRQGERIVGVRARLRGEEQEFHARAVVLACGGFEANREWRARYLGPGWDMAKVRGTRYNTGDGLAMALAAGAQPYGQWSGCHSTAWERNAPEFGNVEEPHNGFRHSYPFGIVVNGEGERFLDEGADFRGFTYAKYGRIILQQPGGFAWQVFDSQVKHLLRDEYKLRGATKVVAATLEELATRMQDVDATRFLATVEAFNAAVRRDIPFDPNIKDGRRTAGLAVDKSNWDNPLEAPPFEAYSVGCGITFTFGGVKIDPRTQVLDIDDTPLPGLYAAGEMAGGIFYYNYPGATGLMSSAVFGRIAGREAAIFAREGSPAD
jgi:tricarballylate dehydrogenase